MKENNIIGQGIERRYFNIDNLELRAEVKAENNLDKRYLLGYFALNNSRSVEMYMIVNDNVRKVTETILPEAFKNTDLSDIVYNVEHDNRLPVARTGSNLEIRVDEKGLFAVATLPSEESATQIQNDLYKNISQKIIRGNSFAFTVAKDGDRFFEDAEGRIHREIRAIEKVYDITSTVSPAYPSTYVFKRNVDEIEKVDKEIEKQETNSGATIDIDFEMSFKRFWNL